MAKLYRPPIPVEVKCRVALRQLEEPRIDYVIDCNRPRRDAGYMVGVVGLPGRSLGRLLEEKLPELADKLGCALEDLRLDHDPALGARPKTGEGKRTRYTPDANDPDALRYRPHGPEFEASHLIKTNVRGDHGQHPDRVLIKKERRRQKAEAEGLDKNVKKKRRDLRSGSAHSHAHKPKTKWAKRAFPKGRGFERRR